MLELSTRGIYLSLKKYFLLISVAEPYKSRPTEQGYLSVSETRSRFIEYNPWHWAESSSYVSTLAEETPKQAKADKVK